VTKNQDFSREFDREIYESSRGFYGDKIYANFAKIAADKSLEVKNIIEEYKQNNYIIVSYGAAAKGNTFINFANLIFDYIFDDTPQKIDKQSPAGGCLVSNPVILMTISQPVLVVIPAWNFGDEILSKLRILRNNSEDYYLVYFPKTILKPVVLNQSEEGNL